jgi:tetratricopeptide (TPR) repeat protein
VQSSGYREAIAFLRHGIELLDDAPGDVAKAELEVEMQLALGSAVMATRSYADPEIETAYTRARALCEEVGSDARAGLALAGLSIYYTNRGEIRVGAELAERVLEISKAHRDDTLELLGHVQLALPRSYQGRAAESLEHALSALALYDPDRHRGVARRFGTDHGVAAHVFAGWGYLIQGYLDQGLAQFDEAVALAELLGQPFNLAYALAFRATSHWERGESLETLHDAGLARQLAREQGFEFWDGVSGVWEEAERVILTRDPARLPQVFEASMLAGSSGNRGGITSVMARIAEAAQAAGDLETTWAFLDAALVASRETEQVWWDSALHRMRAEVLFESSDGEEGITLGDEQSTWERAEVEWLLALDLADQRNYPVHGVRAALGYTELLRSTRRLPDACRMLRHWFDRCPEGHATPVLTRAGATLTGLETAQGGPIPSRDLERQKPRSG